MNILAEYAREITSLIAGAVAVFTAAAAIFAQIRLLKSKSKIKITVDGSQVEISRKNVTYDEARKLLELLNKKKNGANKAESDSVRGSEK